MSNVLCLPCDDLAIWSTAKNLDIANRKLKIALNALSEWADDWKMQVNVDKCECMHFSLDPKEAKCKPNLMFKSQNY